MIKAKELTLVRSCSTKQDKTLYCPQATRQVEGEQYVTGDGSVAHGDHVGRFSRSYPASSYQKRSTFCDAE